MPLCSNHPSLVPRDSAYLSSSTSAYLRGLFCCFHSVRLGPLIVLPGFCGSLIANYALPTCRYEYLDIHVAYIPSFLNHSYFFLASRFIRCYLNALYLPVFTYDLVSLASCPHNRVCMLVTLVELWISRRESNNDDDDGLDQDDNITEFSYSKTGEHY